MDTFRGCIENSTGILQLKCFAIHNLYTNYYASEYMQ